MSVRMEQLRCSNKQPLDPGSQTRGSAGGCAAHSRSQAEGTVALLNAFPSTEKESPEGSCTGKRMPGLVTWSHPPTGDQETESPREGGELERFGRTALMSTPEGTVPSVRANISSESAALTSLGLRDRAASSFPL